ncbi:MAG: superoxide dismutase [Desulfobulbus propionicus]|nr:MAG: superoxide dismutase [Desulfobulbus propionicus]
MSPYRNVALACVLSLASLVGWSLMVPTDSLAHCQVPCGIYDDHARVDAMFEDATTIEKASMLITQLAGKGDAQSQNQLVRWVMTKENHAENVISTISNYFLTQRVKASQEDYAERLAKHHAVMVAAMKTKQNTDPKFVEALKKAIEGIAPYYQPK